MGGLERECDLLARELAVNGFEPVVITEELGSGLPLREKRAGVAVVRIPSNQKRTLTVQLGVAIRLARTLMNDRGEVSFAVVRSFTLPALVTGLLKRLGLLPFPTIVVADTGGDNDDVTALSKRRFSWASKWLVGGNDVLAGICEANVRHLRERGYRPEQIALVPNGIDITPLSIMRPPLQVKRFLFLGRLDKQKGLYELLDAMSKLIETDDEVHLSIAGDGPEAISLQSRISEQALRGRVELLGRVDHSQIGNLFAEHDCLVLPSYSEGCPLSVLEAAAHSRVLVLTDVGDLRKYFDDCAHFCLTEDVNSLVGAMSMAVNSVPADLHVRYMKNLEGLSIQNTTERIIRLMLNCQHASLVQPVATSSSGRDR